MINQKALDNVLSKKELNDKVVIDPYEKLKSRCEKTEVLRSGIVNDAESSSIYVTICSFLVNILEISGFS